MNAETLRLCSRRPGRPTPVGVLALLVAAIVWPGTAGAQVTKGPPRTRYVYIPSDQLDVVFKDASRGVLMPREKFLALWREARRRIASQSAAPVDAVVTGATYDGHLDAHSLRLTGRIHIAKLRPGRQSLKLPFGGLAIESALIDGGPARFGRLDAQTLCLLLDKQGRFELQLEMSAPLVRKEGDVATTLRLPPVPASELSVRLAASKRVQVGATVLAADSNNAGQQSFRIAVGPTGLVPLVISDRSAAGDRAPLVLASSRLVNTVEPAGLRWQVDLDLEVHARATDVFHLQVPPSVEIAEIDAPQLARWTQDAQPDASREVTLAFHKPFLGSRSVRLLGLAAPPESTQWLMPTLRVREASAHVGRVVVRPAPSLRVEVGSLSGIRPEQVPAPADGNPGETARGNGPPTSQPGKSVPTSTTERPTPQPGKSTPAPPSPLTPPALPFAFWDQDFQLPLRVTPRRRSLQASIATLVNISHAGLALRSSATLAPRHAPLFTGRLQVPADWTVTSVLVDGQSADWDLLSPTGASSTGPARTQTVRMALAKPLRPGRFIELTMTAERHPDNWMANTGEFEDVPLPAISVVEADEVEGTILIEAPPDVELLATELSTDLEPVAAKRAGDVATGTPGTALQYRYQGEARVQGTFQVRARPAKVSAETLAFVRLDRVKLNVHYELTLLIEHGKIREIEFWLPASVGQKVQITPVNSEVRVIEQRPVPGVGPGENGQARIRWQVVLDRPVIGDLTLAVDFSQTLSTASGDADPGAPGTSSRPATRPAPVTVPVLTLENVARQSGVVALEAASDQQIDCGPESLRDLDPADVPQPRAYVPTQRIVAAYRYRRPPYRLTLSPTRHASASVLNSLCEAVDIVSVTGRDGRVRHQARFWLRTANLQSVPVKLPEQADLWTVMLDGKPVEVRRQQQRTYIVPLPPRPADEVNNGRELAVVYETRTPVPGEQSLPERLWPWRLVEQCPEVGMTTLGTTWQFYPPEGAELVAVRGDFQPETRLTRATLASRLAEAIVEHSSMGWGWKLGGLVAVAVLVGLFTLLNTGQSCATNLTQLLVAVAVVGLLIALLLPATQSAREAARRMGCSNRLKQIGLALHNYHDIYKQFPPATIGPHHVRPERQFSWIVAILPFLEQQGLYDALRLDLPCDHPQNAAVLQVPMPTVFCPSNPAPPTTQDGFAKTCYVAVTGADVAENGGDPRGAIGLDSGLRMEDITDGTSNTLLVAEVADGGPWFAGGAGTARRIDYWLNNKTWSAHPVGGNALMADGSVQFLSANTDPADLRRLATARAGDAVPKTEERYSTAATGEKPAAAVQTEPQRTTADGGISKPVASQQQGPAPTAGARVKRTPAPRPPEPTTGAATDELQRLSSQGALPARQARGERAGLSLRVALEAHGEQAIRFRSDGKPGQLVVELQDSEMAQSARWFLVAAMLLGAWLGRRRSPTPRAILIVAGLALSIGLVGLIPLAWTPLLDGLLLGSLAAGGLWVLIPLLSILQHRLVGPTATSGSSTLVRSIAIVAALGFAFASADAAAEPPATDAKTGASSSLTLFVPYDPESQHPLQTRQAFLPYYEYLKLWRQAHPAGPGQLPPDVRVLVSHAEYSGQLENDVARFGGRLVVFHAEDRWARVPLPLGDVTLENVELDGRPVALAEGAPAIYLQPSGLHVVDVRFTVPVARLGPTGQFTLPLQAVASGRLLFVLPASDLDVQVSGAPGGWRRLAGELTPLAGTRGDGATASPSSEETPKRAGRVVSVPLGTSGKLSVRWQPRRASAGAGRLASVDQDLLAELRDAGLTLRGKFRYQVRQGTLGELTFRVPAGLAIQRVEGAEVADWSIARDPESTGNGPAAQRLVIRLKSPLTAGTEISVDCFRPWPPVTPNLNVQALAPLDVVRETGRIVLSCADAFDVRVEQAEQLSQIDRQVLEFPFDPGDGCALFAAYRYNRRPWKLGLKVTRKQPQVTAVVRTSVAVSARQATMRSQWKIHVADSPVSFFRLRMPATLRTSQVRVPPGSDWFVEREEAGRYLKVELNRPVLGDLDLAIRGSMARVVDQSEFTVPMATLENVSAQQGQLAVYLNDDLDAVLVTGGGAQSIDPTRLAGVLRASSGRSADYAFRYEAPPSDLRLRLTPAPVRVTSDAVTVVSVREDGVAYVSNVDFDVRQAGLARVRMATPAWLGDDVDIRGEHVRQVRSELQDQHRIWTIELQQPVRGTYRVQLIQTLPLADNGTVLASAVRPLDAERSRSYLVVENLTLDEITPTSSRGVTQISIGAVPNSLADTVRQRAVAAFRVTSEDAELTWQRREREQESGLMASINLADITTVIHADGRYQSRVAYNIRNFTLQFLALELPSDSRVWSVHVSGQPVRPAQLVRNGRRQTLLPLQKTSAGDFSSKVVMVYSGFLGAPLARWTRVAPPAPRIVSDVPVSRTLWTLLLPSEYSARLLRGESNVEAVEAAYQQKERKLSFLDELRQMVQVAGASSKTGAGFKARYNLEQVGSALQNYAQPGGGRFDGFAGGEVQQQAQQIEADIRRLEAARDESGRAEADIDFYFQAAPRPAKTERLDEDLQRSFEPLFGRQPPEQAPRSTAAGPEHVAPAPAAAQQQRGKLRQQVAEQLERLQTMQHSVQDLEKAPVESSKPGESAATKAGKRPVEAPQGVPAAGLDKPMVTGGQEDVSSRSGALSLDLDLAMTGTAYHFRKLHGDPRLVVSARHESIYRLLIALLWCIVCLVMAGAAILGLRRPGAGAFASRAWPWFAASAGAAWLCVLPAGLFGAALLATSLCVLIARQRRREAQELGAQRTPGT